MPDVFRHPLCRESFGRDTCGPVAPEQVRGDGGLWRKSAL